MWSPTLAATSVARFAAAADGVIIRPSVAEDVMSMSDLAATFENVRCDTCELHLLPREPKILCTNTHTHKHIMFIMEHWDELEFIVLPYGS